MTLAPIVAALAVSASAPRPALMAGVARVEITPPLAMKASLGGYGERMSRPATGVHDRLWAKALVLEEGGRRFALVTADILGFPPGFKDAVAAKLASAGWREDDFLLLASHSHTSIDLMAINPHNDLGVPQIGIFQKPLFELTRDRIAQLILHAAKAPVPVKLGWGRETLKGWNRNRRQGNTVTDPELTVGRVDTLEGKSLAVLFNWTAHPTFMDADDMEYSGDWPGHAQRLLEAAIGGGVTAMYFNGAEGDQSPTPRGGASRWERAEIYGLDLGAQALHVYQSVRPSAGAVVAWHVEPIALPKPQWHPDFMRTGGAEYGITPDRAQTMLAHLTVQTSHSTSLRLGDLVIVGIPGELAGGLGIDLKRRAALAAGVGHAVVGGLADEWLSYMLSPEEYHKGGYEASVSTYGETLAPTVVEAALKGAAALRTGPTD